MDIHCYTLKYGYTLICWSTNFPATYLIFNVKNGGIFSKCMLLCERILALTISVLEYLPEKVNM